jgi:hypothetical protein
LIRTGHHGAGPEPASDAGSPGWDNNRLCYEVSFLLHLSPTWGALNG